MTNGSTPAGWYQDPTGQGDARYWNGVAWTQSVDRAGTTVNIAIDPTRAQQPPVPGTQVQAPAPQTVVQQSSSRSPVGAIIGAVVVVLLIVVIFVIISTNSDSSDDSPTPGTGGVPATEPAAPATDPPASGG